MKPRLTFELEPETKSAIEQWARELDRSVGYVLRSIVDKAAQERRSAARVSEAR
jgi:predicted transcriptional regulator